MFVNRYKARGTGMEMIQIMGSKEEFEKHSLMEKEGVTTYTSKKGERYSLLRPADKMEKLVARIDAAIEKEREQYERDQSNFRWWLTTSEYVMLGEVLFKMGSRLRVASLRTVVGMSKADCAALLQCMLTHRLIDGNRALTPLFRKEMREWDKLRVITGG